MNKTQKAAAIIGGSALLLLLAYLVYKALQTVKPKLATPNSANSGVVNIADPTTINSQVNVNGSTYTNAPGVNASSSTNNATGSNPNQITPPGVTAEGAPVNFPSGQAAALGTGIN